MCGNGTVEPPEQCDTTDFDGASCSTLGLGGGALTCNAFCGIVVTGCTPLELCGDSADNDLDGLADCDDSDCAAETSCTNACAAPVPLALATSYNDDIGGNADLLSSSCMPTAGREAVYQFTAVASGDVFVLASMNFDGGIAVRTDCADAASEIACVDAMPFAFADESLTFTALAGQTYFIVVEAVDDGPGLLRPLDQLNRVAPQGHHWGRWGKVGIHAFSVRATNKLSVSAPLHASLAIKKASSPGKQPTLFLTYAITGTATTELCDNTVNQLSLDVTWYLAVSTDGGLTWKEYPIDHDK